MLSMRQANERGHQVVPDVSSCLGDSRERAETLDADHRSMCRYESALDPNYRKVSEELRAVYSGFLHKVDPGEVAMKASLPPAKPTLTCSDQGMYYSYLLLV